MSENEQLEKWSESLSSEDEVERASSARAAIEALSSPGFKSKAALLTVLQASWWPLSPGPVAAAVLAVFNVARTLSSDAPEVEDAALILGNLCREDAAQIPQLIAALSDPSPSVRRAAASAAGRIGEAALGTLPGLIACLSAKEEEVGSAAVESLSALGSLAPEAVAPALLSDIAQSTGTRRYLALAGLRGMLEEHQRAGQPPRGLDSLEAQVMPSLSDEQPAVRLEAASLIGMAKPATAAGSDALKRALGDSSPDVAAYAAVGLLRRHAHSEEALVALEALLMSEDAERSGAALTVLDGLETSTLKRAHALLVVAVKSGPASVRPLAAELLSMLEVQQLRSSRMV